MSDKVIVSMGANRTFLVTDPEAAFGGSDFTDEMRRAVIEGTALDIATRLFLKELDPIIVSDQTAEDSLEGLKRGLTALGVENVQEPIDAAVAKLKDLDPGDLAKLAVQFMS